MEEKKEKIYKFEISHRTIVFTVFFLLSLQFLWLMRDLLFSLLIAFILTAALRPFVNQLTKFKLPRVLAVFIVYLVFIFFFSGLLSIIFPPLLQETLQLSRQLPFILKKIAPNFSFTLLNWETIFQYLPTTTSRVFSVLKNIFSNTVWLISTLFFGFYFLAEEDFIKKVFSDFFEEKKTKKISSLFILLEEKINRWFWGQIVLMVVVGSLTYLGLFIIGIKYPLPLAVLAGLLEVVPNLGPTIAAVPAVLVGFSQSPFLGVSALALAILVQQLENNLIVPIIMKKAVGLNPIITLIALIIGGRLAGVLGVLLAVPITVIIQTLLVEFIKNK